MGIFVLNQKKEVRIIRFGLIIFWWFFWFFNVIDKFIVESVFLWKGKNRIGQLIDYFASIGISDIAIPIIFFLFIAALEIIALVFMTITLRFYFKGDKQLTRAAFFYGILVSLIIFSFFTIGDQIFGDRAELLEHSIYWILTVLSWFVYIRIEKRTIFNN